MKVKQVDFWGLLTFWSEPLYILTYFVIWIIDRSELFQFSRHSWPKFEKPLNWLEERMAQWKYGCVWRTKKITSTSKHCSCLSLSSSLYFLQYCVARVGFCSGVLVSLHCETSCFQLENGAIRQQQVFIQLAFLIWFPNMKYLFDYIRNTNTLIIIKLKGWARQWSSIIFVQAFDFSKQTWCYVSAGEICVQLPIPLLICFSVIQPPH